jgi:hypothetical protein
MENMKQERRQSRKKSLPRMVVVDPPKPREIKRTMSPQRVATPEEKPILGYWDIRGLAQAIRYQLVFQGIDFKDHHLPHTEDV